MLLNYAFGRMLCSEKSSLYKKYLLWLGVGINLGFLGYFKYANFFIDQVNIVFSSDFHLETILLPLAISFFTFQQIAFLVDSYRKETSEFDFLQYCLFVTFFPQLIAGPIVHHKEMMPQFANKSIYKINYQYVAIGLFIFSIGLFKKVILADGIAVYATPVFAEADAGMYVTFFTAWCGALAYTLQLYFDFSGYSDMAIGIAFMFGIKLPLNFNSPYKSVSIIEFWRRWHITLSRFLRDYLYITLGGSQRGNIKRYRNLFLTMLLGGIWHGAGWTFVVWGALHGFYLMINHGWRKLRFNILPFNNTTGFLERNFARFITLMAVIVGWVYFRADSLEGANNMLYAMFGGNGVSLPTELSHLFGNELQHWGVRFEGMFAHSKADLGASIYWIAILFSITLFLPNCQQMIEYKNNNPQIVSQNSVYGIGLVIAALLYIVFTQLSSDAEFLYFNF